SEPPPTLWKPLTQCFRPEETVPVLHPAYDTHHLVSIPDPSRTVGTGIPWHDLGLRDLPLRPVWARRVPAPVRVHHPRLRTVEPVLSAAGVDRRKAHHLPAAQSGPRLVALSLHS